MSDERIKVADATAEQLRTFAVRIMGLEVSDRANRQQVIGKLQEAGFTAETIPALDAQAAPAGRRLGGGGPQRRVRPGTEADPVYEVCVTIQATEQPGGQEPVRCEVNGRAIFIPRGEPVWIAEKYAEVLENAVQYVYEEYSDGLGGLSAPRKVPSYAFSYVSAA